MKGRSVFDSNCAACHAMHGESKGAAAPALAGLFGRQCGGTDFAYSK